MASPWFVRPGEDWGQPGRNRLREDIHREPVDSQGAQQPPERMGQFQAADQAPAAIAVVLDQPATDPVVEKTRSWLVGTSAHSRARGQQAVEAVSTRYRSAAPVAVAGIAPQTHSLRAGRMPWPPLVDQALESR